MNTNINLLPPSNIYSKSLNISVIKTIFLFLILFFTSNTFAVQQEWLMQIVDNIGSPISVKIILYQNGLPIDSGYSANTWVFNPSTIYYKGNVGSDVNHSPGSGDSEFYNPTPTWSIKDPGFYRVRIIYANISDRYFDITIPNVAVPGDADFNIKYNIYSGAVSYVYNGRGVAPATLVSYPWVEHTITVKNSFGGGNIIVDGDTVYNIGVNGKTFTWEQSTFPHTLEAIDQIYGAFMRRFQNWSGPTNNGSTSRNITVDTSDGTYTANFKNEYNITVQNQFSDGTTGGVVTVDGSSRNSPFNTTVEQPNSISISVVSNTINGIDWSFDHWFDDDTINTSRTFYPNDNTTYTVYYKGKPNNNIRNLHFNDVAGQKVTLYWDTNPSPYVINYQIWRKVKHLGLMGNPVNIATVGSSIMSYIDQEYVITSGYTDDLLYYDVRAYYSIDQTYSDPDYLSIFGKQGRILPIANKGNEGKLITNTIKENSIENYPNPFNPSTIIQYQLKESGFVSIKVYDTLGREIAVLVNKEQPSGRYSVTFDASKLTSGIYLYTINAKGFNTVKKMLLLK